MKDSKRTYRFVFQSLFVVSYTFFEYSNIFIFEKIGQISTVIVVVDIECTGVYWFERNYNIFLLSRNLLFALSISTQ